VNDSATDFLENLSPFQISWLQRVNVRSLFLHRSRSLLSNPVRPWGPLHLNHTNLSEHAAAPSAPQPTFPAHSETAARSFSSSVSRNWFATISALTASEHHHHRRDSLIRSRL
jgi:hypothetical protein